MKVAEPLNARGDADSAPWQIAATMEIYAEKPSAATLDAVKKLGQQLGE